MPDKTPAATTTSGKPFTLADMMATMDRIAHLPPRPEFMAAPGFPIRVEPCQFITAQPELRQFRFPRSRKKRIRRKWAKDSRNFRYVEMENIYLVNTPAFELGRITTTTNPMIIGSPEVIAALEAEVRRLNRESDFAMMRSIANGE